MPRLNVVRVVAGGLAAGIAANVLDYLIGAYLTAAQTTEMMQRLNLNAQAVEQSMRVWIGFDMVYGLLVAFTYAAMRPRFGAGPTTALIAGLCYWIGFTAMMAGYSAMGIFTPQAFMKSALLSLASTLVPALMAGAIYQEPDGQT